MKPIISTAFFAATLTIAMSTAAFAASFESLVAEGYKASRLTRNSLDVPGWFLSRGDEKYFCRLEATLAIKNKTKLVSILRTGFMSEVSRKAYETGASSKSLPKLNNLVAGKPRPEDVGACSTAK